MKHTLSRTLALSLALAFSSAATKAEEIGTVDTAATFVGSNHQLKIEAFDDPKVDGASCYLTRPITGGLKGFFGVAEEKSDVSIACRQTGPVSFKDAFRQGEIVFSESRSPLFKTLKVVRFWDEKRSTLVYLSYSDKLIDGSPKNSTSAVTVMPWGTQMPNMPTVKP